MADSRLSCCWPQRGKALGFGRNALILRFKPPRECGQSLEIRLVNAESGEISEVVRFNDLSGARPDRGGYVRLERNIEVPRGFKSPGAVLVSVSEGDALFLVSVGVFGRWTSFWKRSWISFSCFSWISSDQGERLILPAIPTLPGKTPPGIKDLRVHELETIRQADDGMRVGNERVYGYDVYNDLAINEKRRPLGGSEDCPYPRRLRTGRPMNPDGISEFRPFDPVSGFTLPFWVPRDDDFIPEKIIGTSSRAEDISRSTETAIREFVGFSGTFPDLSSIESMYTPAPMGPGFPLPKIIEDRGRSWLTDEEFGRQRVAGLNPATIEAIDSLPKGSSITDLFVKPSLLGGVSLEDRLGQKRMFIIDYTDPLLEFVDRINRQEGHYPRYQYAPRCLLFLNDNKQLVPVAIELSKPGRTCVYTPESSLTEWSLAKAHFVSADVSVHEMYIHLTRCHTATEPYIISTRRNLSPMHPVFRLLMPHFSDTIRTNADARQRLINYQGLMETLFTPGAFSNEYMAALYKKRWRFRTESLPGDLLKRNMATEQKGGNWKAGDVDLVLDGYPYAEDGLLVWKALYQWVRSYLSIYYAEERDVVGDLELRGWWREIQSKGHPDLVAFGIASEDEVWPDLKNVEDLVYILTTMMWITSGHHAAIHYGQYDLMGYMPNAPTYMVARMPPPVVISEPPGVLDEKIFLGSMSPPPFAVTFAGVTENLSVVNEGEVQLGTEIPYWLVDRKARNAFNRFSVVIKEIEKTVHRRNEAGNNPLRGFPYTLLLPNLPEGSTPPILPFRGILNNIAA